jgi:hypothetical protein
VTRSKRRAIAIALLATGLTACPAPEPRADAVALGLFDLARERPRSEDRIDALFVLERDDPRRVALLDALDRLGVATEPQVTDLQTMSELGRTVVDLYGELPGGGIARYSVQLERSPADGWKVSWFHGPGFAWPPVQQPRDQGLSSSPSPR